MNSRHLTIIAVLCSISLAVVSLGRAAENKDKGETKPPAKVYVPYEELKGVFEKEQQGVFLSYKEFQRLWRAAQGKPTAVSEAPFEYLVSTARFHGDVKEEIATLRLELTMDVLNDGWVQVPLGLGEVAVSEATLLNTQNSKIAPLLRVVNGEYILVAKGKGRYVLTLDFVRQLETQPGLAVLKYRIPSAAITTLELLIPEENLKVDVQPMLAATTSQVEVEGAKATRLQAFLGSAKDVRLSWKPKTEAAAELEPVVICEQFQHINVAEALISHEVTLDYNIHRGGVGSFAIQLPGEFRVTDVSGANIAKWDIETSDDAAGRQMLQVKLFSAAKDKYTLTVKMERFLQEAQAQVQLVPIMTEQVLRRSGLIGITYSPRRLVQLEGAKNLARVDTGQLPKHLQNAPRVTAYRFITSDYSSTIMIETTSPRITVNQRWMLGVDSDRLGLQGKVRYKVERTGIFELNMNLPEPWDIETVGPDELVDDYQLKGKGNARILRILLRREKIGEFELTLVARAERPQPQGLVDFVLPLADANDLQSYEGQLILLLADQLQAEMQEANQLQAIGLKQAEKWTTISGLSPAMAFDFRAIDRQKGSGVTFKIAVKPVQVSATVHRLVNIQPGSIEQEAVIQYRVRYAPLDTFYLKMPAELADSGAQITGVNIKEKPRVDELPLEQRSEVADPNTEGVEWAYYKVVLQSDVTGSYQLNVSLRRPFQAGRVGQAATVKVEPILAAGKLSDQNGHIAIAKADTLAIGEPVIENLIPADASSPADLPYQTHRRVASLAFKYNAPLFELSLPVVAQKEATVFTTIVSGVIIEQVLARDGMLNTHATYLLATSRGDRLPITLPAKVELTAVLLNGSETPIETGVSPDELIVRLPPSAGQISRFVLEISYGLKGVSASNLVAPALPEGVPVQQTLWRLWVPEDYCLLWHKRVFARLASDRCQNVLQRLGSNQPSQVQFNLPAQGKDFNFIRQGAPGRLSVVAARKEVASVVVWVLIVVAGVLMLKLSGFHRVLIILAAALVGGVLHLFLPLLVNRVLRVGVFAGVLILLLWAAQWWFSRLPELWQRRTAKRQKALQKKRERKGRKQQKEGTAQEPRVPDKEQ
jgi:hypothetical protein